MRGGRFVDELAKLLNEWEEMHLPFAALRDELLHIRQTISKHITGELNEPAKEEALAGVDFCLRRVERTIGAFTLIQQLLTQHARNNRGEANDGPD